MTQLRRLTFSDNEIQRISPEIGQLVNLEELDCSRNGDEKKETNEMNFFTNDSMCLDIADIPDNIRHCRSLEKLDCSGNPLANK